MKRINWLLITLLLAACSKTDKQLISEAEAEAKEKSIQTLREHELMLTVSRSNMAQVKAAIKELA